MEGMAVETSRWRMFLPFAMFAEHRAQYALLRLACFEQAQFERRSVQLRQVFRFIASTI